MAAIRHYKYRKKKWKNTFPMQCFVIYSQICESKRQPTEYNEELVATQ